MLKLVKQSLIAIFILLSLIPVMIRAQDGNNSSQTYWAQRAEIDRLAKERLQEIESTAIGLGLENAKQTSTLFALDRDPRRQYIFLPGEKPLPDTESIEPINMRRYVQAIHRLRIEHATRLFELAKSIAASDPGRSYQLVNEAVWVNPDHEEGRRILGWTKGRSQWSKPDRTIRERKTRQAHDLFNWQPDNYSVIRSGHFEVATTADVQTVINLVEKMETWRDVWRQVALVFWSDDEVMSRCFDSGGRIRDSINKRHKVVVFRDKQQYIQHLKPLIPGVEVSSGYYDFKSETSFFYLGENNESTSRHELVHQLFQETIRADKNVADSRHIWAIEGIAMYFESLQHRDTTESANDFYTLGGFESHRLQFARVRKLREGFYLPMVELTGMQQKHWMQRGPQRIYSQCAGLAHLIMNGEQGKNRQAFLQWLKSVYEDSKVDEFQRSLEKSFTEIDQQYDEFLKVKKDEIRFADFEVSQPTILCLRGAELDSTSIKLLGQAKSIGILDLGKTAISDTDASVLSNFQYLAQLFLDETSLTDKAMPAIGDCKELRELDVANTRLTDAGLKSIARLTNLQVLWLSDTNLTDEGIKQLEPLKNLASLDISRTSVTLDGLKWLKERLPNLK